MCFMVYFTSVKDSFFINMNPLARIFNKDYSFEHFPFLRKIL